MGKIVVGISGIAVAAFAVWLAVRIINRRERWAKQSAAALFIGIVLYPLSSGPMTWVLHHCDLPIPAFGFVLSIYRPWGLVVENLPEPLNDAGRKYESFFVNFG